MSLPAKTIWWEHSTAPAGFLEKILNLVQNGQSVWVNNISTLPWKEEFFRLLANRLSRADGRRTIKHIDKDIPDPNRYMFDYFCDMDEIRYRYRPGKSYGQFLGEQETMLDSCFIVIKEPENPALWNEFIGDCLKGASGKARKPVFLVFCDTAPSPVKKGVELLDPKLSIRKADKDCALLQISVSSAIPEMYAEYASYLSAYLCPDSLEAAAACLGQGEKFLKDPAKTLEEALAGDSESAGTAKAAGTSGLDPAKAVWQAQIKALYPMIESYRRALISENADRLRNHVHEMFGANGPCESDGE